MRTLRSPFEESLSQVCLFIGGPMDGEWVKVEDIRCRTYHVPVLDNRDIIPSYKRWELPPEGVKTETYHLTYLGPKYHHRPLMVHESIKEEAEIFNRLLTNYKPEKKK
jgi:hypothetical protein